MKGLAAAHFCLLQINRTVTKVEFSRIVHKLIGVQLSDKVCFTT
jgi:hypothetical protein